MYHLFTELISLPLHKENTAKNFALDLTDDVVKPMCVIHEGAFIWKPMGPPPP